MLEIGIGDSSSSAPLLREPSLFLEDDGYYSFLHPLFAELAQETGQYVDLYGDARFEGGDLLALERTLRHAVAFVEIQPESWAESVGHAGARGEVYMGVLKPGLLEILSEWLMICVKAREQSLSVVCFGD